MKKVTVTTNIPLEDNKTQTITSNGTTTITPTSGKTAMKKVTVTTNVPQGTFDSEIDALVTKTVTSNGDVTISPTTGKKAMKQAKVTVNVPEKKIQSSKSVSVSKNGSSTITPDSGYDGIKSITVNTSVEQGVLNSKIQTGKTVTITSNTSTTITPDTNYDAIKQVTVTTNIPLEDNKTQTITTFGAHKITPSNGYQAMKNATITVDRKNFSLNLQDITKTYNKNGTYTINFDESQYDGIKSITLKLDVKESATFDLILELLQADTNEIRYVTRDKSTIDFSNYSNVAEYLVSNNYADYGIAKFSEVDNMPADFLSGKFKITHICLGSDFTNLSAGNNAFAGLYYCTFFAAKATTVNEWFEVQNENGNGGIFDEGIYSYNHKVARGRIYVLDSIKEQIISGNACPEPLKNNIYGISEADSVKISEDGKDFIFGGILSDKNKYEINVKFAQMDDTSYGEIIFTQIIPSESISNNIGTFWQCIIKDKDTTIENEIILDKNNMYIYPIDEDNYFSVGDTISIYFKFKNSENEVIGQTSSINIKKYETYCSAIL